MTKLALLATLLLASASPVSAHYRPLCGHGDFKEPGYGYYVDFVWLSSAYPLRRHYHYFDHYRWSWSQARYVFEHSERALCGWH
jgi:hypothetical protein